VTKFKPHAQGHFGRKKRCKIGISGIQSVWGKVHPVVGHEVVRGHGMPFQSLDGHMQGSSIVSVGSADVFRLENGQENLEFEAIGETGNQLKE
jgi:hypothetical protein